MIPVHDKLNIIDDTICNAERTYNLFWPYLHLQDQEKNSK